MSLSWTFVHPAQSLEWTTVTVARRGEEERLCEGGYRLHVILWRLLFVFWLLDRFVTVHVCRRRTFFELVELSTSMEPDKT